MAIPITTQTAGWLALCYSCFFCFFLHIYYCYFAGHAPQWAPCDAFVVFGCGVNERFTDMLFQRKTNIQYILFFFVVVDDKKTENVMRLNEADRTIEIDGNGQNEIKNRE